MLEPLILVAVLAVVLHLLALVAQAVQVLSSFATLHHSLSLVDQV
jgi:hypothetical protein